MIGMGFVEGEKNETARSCWTLKKNNSTEDLTDMFLLGSFVFFTVVYIYIYTRI